ncbi:MAG TPA: hypothetical protein VEP90_16525 [Methylomirabilota bacterium]|nr:hypothetical protein [Methylomirabilota bacterium]
MSSLTVTVYRSVFQQLFTWLTETDNTVTGVDSITPGHIEDYLAHLRDKVRIGNSRDFAKL